VARELYILKGRKKDSVWNVSSSLLCYWVLHSLICYFNFFQYHCLLWFSFPSDIRDSEKESNTDCYNTFRYFLVIIIEIGFIQRTYMNNIIHILFVGNLIDFMQMDQWFEKIDQQLQELHKLFLKSQKDSPTQPSTSIVFHPRFMKLDFPWFTVMTQWLGCTRLKSISHYTTLPMSRKWPLLLFILKEKSYHGFNY